MRKKDRDKPKQNRKAPNDGTAEWKSIEQVIACELARTILIWGPPGVGKTYAALHASDDRPVYVVTLTQDTPAAELRGSWMPKGNEFVWQHGVLVQAMLEGARLVINEISHGAAEVMAILYPILESPETAQLTLPTLETIKPAPGFRVIATDNVEPDHLPLALQDRFVARLHVNRPHPGALERLRPALREAALRTFDLEPERAVSLRGWIAVQDLEGELGLEAACLAVFGEERGRQVHTALQLGEA